MTDHLSTDLAGAAGVGGEIHPLADAIERAGGLVGATAAAAILGVARPNLHRYRDRLTVIPIEGARSGAYVAAEVARLAQILRDTNALRPGRRPAAPTN